MPIAFSRAIDATMKTYNQLTCEQRSQIYPLNKTGFSQNKIERKIRKILTSYSFKALADKIDAKTGHPNLFDRKDLSVPSFIA